MAQIHYTFMDRVAALPGVQSVGLVNTLPLDEGAPSRRFSTERTGEGWCGGASREYDLRRRRLLPDDGH